MGIVDHIADVAQGKTELGKLRSGRWPAVRKQHLDAHPHCEVCGSSAKVEVHHIEPFHIQPARELDPDNLITLCEVNKGGVNCHLFIGHLGNYRSYNVEVRADSLNWSDKIKNRPSGDA